eukprot:3058146-Pleurochrysis_carterae.AAC.1
MAPPLPACPPPLSVLLLPAPRAGAFPAASPARAPPRPSRRPVVRSPLLRPPPRSLPLARPGSRRRVGALSASRSR